MNSLLMWLGLVLLITALCLASASGSFTKKSPRRSGITRTGAQPIRRVAGLLFFAGIMLWIIGALLTAGGGR